MHGLDRRPDALRVGARQYAVAQIENMAGRGSPLAQDIAHRRLDLNNGFQEDLRSQVALESKARA